MTNMIKVFRCTDVPDETREILDYLVTDPDDSVMLKDFYKYIDTDAPAYVYLNLDVGIITGWALNYEPPGENFCVIQMFVIEAFRRRGVGTRLFNGVEISNRGRAVHPVESDSVSAAFYKKMFNPNGEIDA